KPFEIIQTYKVRTSDIYELYKACYGNAGMHVHNGRCVAQVEKVFADIIGFNKRLQSDLVPQPPVGNQTNALDQLLFRLIDYQLMVTPEMKIYPGKPRTTHH